MKNERLMNDFFSNYDANAINFINGLYIQLRNLMEQYGGHAELKRTPRTPCTPMEKMEDSCMVMFFA